MELLVNFGADLLYKPPKSGLNATQLALKLGQDRIVKFLTFYSQKKKVPKQEIPRILDGPEKANKLLKVAKSQRFFSSFMSHLEKKRLKSLSVLNFVT